MSQLVKCLPSVHKAWVSLAVVYKPETGCWVHNVVSTLGRLSQEDCREFIAIEHNPV